jgi:hypothetical protein
MTDPYVSFDTFSLGDSTAEPAPTPARPSLLAKLPRVAPTTPRRPKSIQRFDDAETPLHGVHLGEAGADLAMAGPLADPGPVARRFSSASPIATLRIDTVSPTTFDDAPPAKRAAAPETAAVSPPPAEAVIDDPWAAWLLNLESAITPYSRIIVLGAVIAAMGLTIVLLRGGAKPTQSQSLSPQVSADGGDDSLVATEIDSNPSAFSQSSTFSQPWTAAPSMWPSPTPPTTTGELLPIGAPTAATTAAATPINSTAVASTPVASAAGPASAWRGPAGARLTGQVLPVEEDRVNVAEAPTYPTTTR